MCRGLCPDARGLCLDVPAAYTGQALQLPMKQAFNSSGGYDHTVARQRAPRRPQRDITFLRGYDYTVARQCGPRVFPKKKSHFSGGTTTPLRGNVLRVSPCAEARQLLAVHIAAATTEHLALL